MIGYLASMAEFSKYYLRRWSLLVRLRDGFMCFMCERKCRRVSSKSDPLSWTEVAEAHHIMPKAKHPETAYDLDNGITLCWRCHRRIVHTSWWSWKKWVFAFKMYQRRKINKAFNQEHNHKCRPKDGT